MNSLASGFFALVGVLIGGGLSYAATMNKTALDNKWKRDENIQKRLEEAYETAEEIKQGFLGSAVHGLKRVHFGSEIPIGDKIPIEKLKMLTDFYAPEANDHYMAILEAREEFGTPFTKAISSGKLPKAEAQLLSKNLMDKSHQIDNACSIYQEKILLIARSLKGARTQSK